MRLQGWWLEVDPEGIQILIGILYRNGTRSSLREVKTFKGKPRWLEFFSALCQGKWLDESSVPRRSLLRIERFLEETNQAFRAEFRLALRIRKFPKGRPRVQVGLVGG